ncbi:ABC transporter permease [Oceanomicrobium pacificus]|uniref:FtsX-like permease family protein n=1 Tax=Oceanomicrobium pacificus TaxID=2692916 RepID=A0A6B0TPW8_9RHOB|nr:FtsX-like permease family protein [Oceanomicrobium pacificus]MXU63835.1 FtsX-like permease family protein [Oceanomicrobium pacificus]
MRPGLAWRLARRDLRGAIGSFRVFLLCLTLGVAAIAAVGTVRTAISEGLSREASRILGGDAEIRFTYRFATDAERAFIEAQSVRLSEIVDFRSMIRRDDGTEGRSLVQVKGVDDAYPLVGAVTLDPPMPLADAFAGSDGLPGLLAAPELFDRLGVDVGAQVALGTQSFVLMARIAEEPDSMGGGFGFGPRVITTRANLADSGLLAPGTLFDSAYRMVLPPQTDLDALRDTAESRFPDTGLRWTDRRNGTPGLSRFVDRMGAFLVLVGLAGLAVGGIGVAAAVRTYLDTRIETIATLKTLGATGSMIFLIYGMQIGLLAVIGVGLGLILGYGLPALLAPFLADRLPVPALFGLYPVPLAEAALYGLLAAALFSVWPLARARDTRAAALFRDLVAPGRVWPRWPVLATVAALAVGFVAVAALLSGLPRLAFWTGLGIALVLLILLVAALGLRRLAARLARGRAARGAPLWRQGLAALGGAGSEAVPVILSLGLGLTVLSTIVQIDRNFRQIIDGQLPEIAPAFFFLDIQPDQMPEFLDRATALNGGDRIETAPMLRGVITRINDRPAAEVAGEHWVLRGDRGITYAATPPTGTEITAGAWWDADHDGPPQMSFAAEEAEELGLSLGDRITVNVLGRDLTAEVTSFRTVDFGDMGINFVMIVDPKALAGAPHTAIATVYADAEAEAPLLRDLTGRFPNVTGIGVRAAMDRVGDALAALAAGTSWGASVTLLTGFVVLIGAAAAGERRRTYEAAILKTLGAQRRQILAGLALRSALLGAAAGLVAVLAGSIAAWAVMTFVMDGDFVPALGPAGLVILGGALANLAAGLGFAWRPLSARPARILRARD